MDAKKNGILALDPTHYREIDGVVFDLDSYARHCDSAPVQDKPCVQAPSPAPVFPTDPIHVGWYESADNRPPVPMMGGCLPSEAVAQHPAEGVLTSDYFAENESVVTVTRTRLFGSAGSGSYLSSYTTSLHSSGSYRFGSGSGSVGGYGLELI